MKVAQLVTWRVAPFFFYDNDRLRHARRSKVATTRV